MDEEDGKLNCGAPDVTVSQNIEINVSSDAIHPGRQSCSRVIVHIKSATLSGIVERLPDGKKFFIFKGVPYAQAPVGELRFKPPRPLEKLPAGILDCSKDGPGCFTVDNYLPNDRMSESCLNLNVYTPTLPNQSNEYREKIPVMVWIHGGGFVGGSAQSSMYNPKYLIQNDVVVVTINYRLGPLGFLCLPSMGIYGNMGLKDQRMAFRWVRENISNFGGDPNNVTIFGQSAGGASVHLHYLSESSRKYFHKAIAQSGCAFNQWVFQKESFIRARKLAKVLGCESTSDDNLIYETLMKASPKELTELQYAVMTNQERSILVNFPFTPVVEQPTSEDPIIQDSPLVLIKKHFPRRIPLIMGITNEEGAGLAGHVIANMEQYTISLAEQAIPFTLNVENEHRKQCAFQKIKQFFFKNKDLSLETVPIMVQILGDNANKFAGYLSAELHARSQRSPLYFYVFSYMSELNKMRELAETPANCPGAVHGDELCYLFESSFFKTESIPSRAAEHRRTMCRLWTNFAKNGIPTADDTIEFNWPAIDELSEGSCFELNAIELNETFQTICNPFAERFNFWKSLHTKYNGCHLNPVIVLN